MLKCLFSATLRSLPICGPPLDIMVEAANRIFSQITLAGQFATVVVGRAEPDGGVEFVSAGHPPVLHLRKDTCVTNLPRGFPSECLTAFDFRLAASLLIVETCCCSTRMD